MKHGKKKRRRKAGRRIPRPLWGLLGLAALGVTATVLSSRRIEPLEDWEDLLDDDEEGRRETRFPSTSVKVAGPVGELAVDDGGSGGLPVVMIHGLGGASGHWAEQLAHLRASRRALALDLRGHGSSAAPEGPDYGIEAFVADLGAVVDGLGLERFVLAGHSLGATVAIAFARRSPERVAGLLLVDPNGDQTEIPRDERDSFLGTLESDPRGEMRTYFKQILIGAEPGVADQVLADLAAVPAEAFPAALRSAFEVSPAAALADYPGPRLSVISDLNRPPFSLHNLVPDLPVRLIPGTSHWPMMDRPEEIDGAFDELLSAIEG
jgi:pimeloyl-ACP methyl ester carboxylesterase